MIYRPWIVAALLSVGACVALPRTALAAEATADKDPAAAASATDDAAQPADQTETPARQPAPPKKVLSKDPPGMKRLMPDADVWIDPKHKRVVMDGEVCLRAGTLEMFACLKGTKEHESIVAVDTKAWPVHAALLAVGAKNGAPVQFQPTFRAAAGTTIDVTVIWKDEKGAEHQDRAQDWIRNLRTGKPLEYSWVFGGSGFDITRGQKYYRAEGGDFICVSNFPSAMLDLPFESGQATADLLFEAFSEKIPPRGTKVRLVLTPRLEKK